MSRADGRLPVVVGVAQWVERDAEPERALDPLSILELVARRAADDAGVGEQLWAVLERIAIPMQLSWPLRNPAHLLAKRLGASPRDEIRSTVGGHMPVRLLNDVARDIRAGRLEVALVAGSEAQASVDRARCKGVELDWPTSREEERTVVGSRRAPLRDDEQRHGLVLPGCIYPVFENVRRARLGWDLATHQERIGELCSRLTEQAAANPYAWFPKRLSTEEIVRVTAENRRVAFPYTKRMNSMPGVNLGAALLVTSLARARTLGVAEERIVYWWGGAEALAEPWFLSEREQLDDAAALGSAARGALEMAATPPEQVDRFDLYSCFPVAVSLACEGLGLSEDDPRSLTVTGGLPYAGGPWNDYCTHAIAAMVERLRESPGAKGLVTGMGWYLTCHAAAVLASAPPTAGPGSAARTPRARPVEPVAIAPAPEGRGRVEGYTVLYQRDGSPERGIVIGRLEDGRRFLANTPDDARALEDFARREAVGRTGRVTPGEPVNRFDPD